MEEELQFQTPILEERQELIVSPTSDKTPFLRTARFLRPTISSSDKELPNLPSLALSSLDPPWDLHNLPLNLIFQGWRSRPRNWGDWVEKMAALHEPIWRQAGIYDAVIGSGYQIKRNIDLVVGLAEKWCCETKTFIFPWGEATVTLEDVMLLGGYSVMGASVFTSLQSEELKVIEESLKAARMEIVRTKAKKASPHLWMDKFMDCGSNFEHEAFLTCWLSRYVFVNARETIRDHVVPMAILLARGTRIAIGPAVLASIYRDLCSFKDAIISSTRLGKEEVVALTLWSSFQLVQAWAWERFPMLRPEPSLRNAGEPRLALWRDVNRKVDNVRAVLNSTVENFEWRPYTRQMDSWNFPKFYVEKENYVSVSATLDGETESFIRCMRACELVGLDCIEQYLPNRVAMQFGMDQDVPAYVVRSNQSPEFAWSSYNQPIGHAVFIIPSHAFRGGITLRYSIWWEQSMSGLKAIAKSIGKPKQNSRGARSRLKNTAGKRVGLTTSTCTGSHNKRPIVASESLKGGADDSEAAVAPDHLLASSVLQVLRRKGKRGGAIASDSSSPIKKSKTVEQLLKGNKLGSGGSNLRVTNNNSSKDLRKNGKRKRRGAGEFESPELPSASLKGGTLSSKRKLGASHQSASNGPQQKLLKTSIGTTKRKRKKKQKPNSSSAEKDAKGAETNGDDDDDYDDDDDDDSASESLPSRRLKKSAQTAKEKKGSASSPMNSTPNIVGIKEEDSLDENNPTIAELMRSCKNHGGVAPTDHDDSGHSSGHSQSISSTVADNEAANYLEPLVMVAERAMQDEATATLEGSGKMGEGKHEDQRESTMGLHVEGVPEGASDPVEAANKETSQAPNKDKSKGEGGSSDLEMSGLTLEARVIRLERLFSKLTGETLDIK